MMVALSTMQLLGVVILVLVPVFLLYCIAIMARNSNNLKILAESINLLLQQGHLDREAREHTLLTLQQDTHQLALRNEAVLKDRDIKIESLHQITVEAARASVEAAHVANSMNEKILHTNQRIVEAVKLAADLKERADAKVAGAVDQTSQDLHTHIEEAIDTERQTLETAGNVEKKVDRLSEKP